MSSGLEKNKAKLFILVSIVVAIAITFGCYSFLNKHIITGAKGNIFYTSTVKYTLPIVNEINENSGVSHDYELKTLILDALGINIYNPLSIIKSEMPFLYGSIDSDEELERANEKEKVISLNPFKLAEASITKNGGESKEKTPEPPVENTNVGDVINPNIKKPLDKSKPQVLIYHTHLNESYNSTDFDSDLTKNMYAVGEEVAKSLEKDYGVAVLHDKTFNDIMYTTAYKKSRQTVGTYLDKYGDFKIILDLHRDAGPTRNQCLTKMNGEDVAKIRLVVSKGRPNINKNMEMVNSILDIGPKLYPSLFFSPLIYGHGTGHFNQDLNPNMILIEVGSNKNNLNEAKASGKYIARVLAEYLNKAK